VLHHRAQCELQRLGNHLNLALPQPLLALPLLVLLRAAAAAWDSGSVRRLCGLCGENEPDGKRLSARMMQKLALRAERV
jgi:hypothetical protein